MQVYELYEVIKALADRGCCPRDFDQQGYARRMFKFSLFIPGRCEYAVSGFVLADQKLNFG